jgi:ATP-dependent DNA ligase
LYDDGGTLHHVGVASGFSVARQKELLADVTPLRDNALDNHPWREWATAALEASENAVTGRMPGGQSRWNAGRDMSWEPVRPEKVVEVAYDHLQGDRFRHATSLVRWRPDRDPTSCTYSQLDAAVPEELASVFGA